jgi:hypothetical protein
VRQHQKTFILSSITLRTNKLDRLSKEKSFIRFPPGRLRLVQGVDDDDVEGHVAEVGRHGDEVELVTGQQTFF